MEGRALVTLGLLALAKLTEVASGLGDVLLEELEDDAARLGCSIQETAAVSLRWPIE